MKDNRIKNPIDPHFRPVLLKLSKEMKYFNTVSEKNKKGRIFHASETKNVWNAGNYDLVYPSVLKKLRNYTLIDLYNMEYWKISDIENLPVHLECILENLDDYFAENRSNTTSDEIFDLGERAYTKENYAEALIYYKKAADMDHSEAQFSIGYMYDVGTKDNEIDYFKAFKYYKKAAEQGHKKAMCNLSICYQEGNGTPVNDKLAKYWNDKYEDNITYSAEIYDLKTKKIIKNIDEIKSAGKERTTLNIDIDDFQKAMDDIKVGECSLIEFKSSYIFDHNERQEDQFCKFYVLKQIVGFLNSEGGDIYLGVSDSENIIGLENDLKILANHEKKAFRKDVDGLIQYITANVENQIEGIIGQYISIRKITYKNKILCRISIKPSQTPIVTKEKLSGPKINIGKTENKEKYEDKYFVRSGNVTKSYSFKNTAEYIYKRTLKLMNENYS